MNRERAFETLRPFLREHREEVVAVVLYATCVGLLALATPVAVQALVNTVAFATLMQPLVVLVGLLFLGLVASGVLKALKAWTAEVLQRRMFALTAARLAHRLPRAVWGTAELRDGSLAVHRFFDLFSLQKSAASLLLGGVDLALAALVGLIVLAFYHPMLLAFDVLLVVVILIIVFWFGRGGLGSSVDESSAKYALAGLLAEVGRDGTVFRDRGGRAYVEERIDALARSYLGARGQHFRVVLRQFVGGLAMQAFASALLLGLGGVLVLQRELTLGQLVAAELIVSVFVSTFNEFGKYVETYYDLVTSAYKLEGLLCVPLEPEGEGGEADLALAQGTPATVELVDVYLRRSGRSVLEGARLHLAAGSRMRLFGAGESGKSTIVELLFGTLTPDRGYVRIDGADTRELSRAALRDRVAVLRGPELITGSVVDNVRLGRKDIPLSQVRQMLDALGLTEELSMLPDGLETDVGPLGERVSAGQAFRISLARCLVRRPGILAIDADLAALDARTIALVRAVFRHHEGLPTLLVIGEHEVARALCPRAVALDARVLQEHEEP